MENIVGLLRDRGLKPSIQRIQIYNCIKDRTDHPTVDMIYSELIADIPTLSKTTVYNTLKSFVEAGLATPIIIEENEIRYDPNIKHHGHFKCESCGNIFDFVTNFSKFGAPELIGFKITEQHVYFKGICNNCL
jgi:Fur family peroxide stress response transcriptional regulator